MSFERRGERTVKLRQSTRRGSVLALPVVVVLALAGCGNGAPTTAAAPAASVPGVTSSTLPVVATEYSVSLAGFKGGAPNASALALISINASTNELCWQFTQLKNVSAPTVARLYRVVRGQPGTAGLPLGHAYKLSGCVPQPRVLLGLIEAHPYRFAISIHSARFPGGAVHARL
jgi:hypothetical protein